MIVSKKNKYTSSGGRLFVLGLIFLAILSYANSLNAPFYFDDRENITQNKAIQLEKITLTGLYNAAFNSPIATRPVANISFAFNYFFHGLWAGGFRITNIVIHILNGILVFYLFRYTLNSPACRGSCPGPDLTAFCAAAIWVVHPLATQSVTYIVQRMNSLCVLFLLGAFLLFIKCVLAPSGWRKCALAAASLALWLLAMGSKEIAVTFPLCGLLYYWYFHADLSLDWLKKNKLSISIALGTALLLILMYSQGDPLRFILQGYNGRSFSLTERLLTESRVVLYYLGLIAWPIPARLHLDYDFPLSLGLLSPPTTLVAICCLIFLLGIAILTARNYRIFSFAMLWFLVNLVLESSLIPLEIAYEHRTYLPMLYLCLVPAVYVSRTQGARRTGAIFLIPIAVLSYLTFQRNNVWLDPVQFWQQNIELAPDKARPYNELGIWYGQQENLSMAQHYFSKALAVDSGYAPAYGNLGSVMAMEGYLEAAENYFTKAIERQPGKGTFYLGLGRVRLARGDYEGAISALQGAVSRKRVDPDPLFLLGQAHLAVGQCQEAATAFTHALTLQPDNATFTTFLLKAQACGVSSPQPSQDKSVKGLPEK
jgi:tetratricopeptide (TPR) repeat protein